MQPSDLQSLGLMPPTSSRVTYHTLSNAATLQSLNHVVGTPTPQHTCDSSAVRSDLERFSQNVLNRLRMQDEAIDQISRKSDRLYDKLIGKNELAYDKLLQEFKKVMSILNMLSNEVNTVQNVVDNTISVRHGSDGYSSFTQNSPTAYYTSAGVRQVVPRNTRSPSVGSSITDVGSGKLASRVDEEEEDLKEFQLAGIVQSEAELHQWMKNNGPLSRRDTRARKFGYMARYRCGKRRLYGGCPIQVRVRNHVETGDIEILKKGEHVHDESKVNGLPASMKSMIEECSRQGMGPSKIHELLQQMKPAEFPDMPVPSILCITNAVGRFRLTKRKSLGIPPRPFIPSVNPRKRRSRTVVGPPSKMLANSMVNKIEPQPSNGQPSSIMIGQHQPNVVIYSSAEMFNPAAHQQQQTTPITVNVTSDQQLTSEQLEQLNTPPHVVNSTASGIFVPGIIMDHQPAVWSHHHAHTDGFNIALSQQNNVSGQQSGHRQQQNNQGAAAPYDQGR